MLHGIKMKKKNIKICGSISDMWLYSLMGVLGGVGIGIIISNTHLFSANIGLIVAIVSVILSVYIWNKKIRRIFEK